MREKFVSITLDDREFHLLFSLAAMGDIVERFGSLQALTEKMDTDADYASAVRLVPWLFCILANQGEYLKAGGKADVITEAWAGAHIMPRQIAEVMGACQQALNIGLEMEHKPGDDEAVDVVLEELQKNAEGAGA